MKTKQIIRTALKRHLPGRFIIKAKGLDRKSMNRKLFIETLTTLREIEDRTDFLGTELGLDVTAYENKFFHVIENLLKMHFSKDQLALIQYWLYQLPKEKEYAGTIKITQGKSEKEVPFKTPSDVWQAVLKV
jgi:hypothetical protein